MFLSFEESRGAKLDAMGGGGHESPLDYLRLTTKRPFRINLCQIVHRRTIQHAVRSIAHVFDRNVLDNRL